MSEFEDNLRTILSDPAELERIGRLASELMGGGPAETPPAEPAAGGGDVLRRLGALIGGASAADKTALVEALSPYLQPERRARLGRALRLAGMLRMAAAAMGEEGGLG